MAINALTKDLTGRTTDGAFGPVPAGKEWIIKFMSITVTTSGTVGEVDLEINSIKVAETDQLLSSGNVDHLVGSDQPQTSAVVATNVIATAGQDVDVVRDGGTFIWAAHMSYAERDIP